MSMMHWDDEMLFHFKQEIEKFYQIINEMKQSKNNISQLFKDVPFVKSLNYADPNWALLTDVIKTIESLTNINVKAIQAVASQDAFSYKNLNVFLKEVKKSLKELDKYDQIVMESFLEKVDKMIYNTQPQKGNWLRASSHMQNAPDKKAAHHKEHENPSHHAHRPHRRG